MNLRKALVVAIEALVTNFAARKAAGYENESVAEYTWLRRALEDGAAEYIAAHMRGETKREDFEALNRRRLEATTRFCAAAGLDPSYC